MPRLRTLAAFASAVGLLAISGLGVAACASAPPAVVQAPSAPPSPPPPPPGPDPSRFHALLLNGGGNPGINYQPHLLHLRAMRDLLLAAGLAPDHIAVFSSDGPDPAPDLVVRDTQPERDFWLLDDTRLERPLETQRRLVSSAIEGATLQPATKVALGAWFDAEARALTPGDTLVLYVTDHGNRGGPDPTSNTIQLWGGEQLSVRELHDLVAKLPAGVRVVSLMSQCFSGGFAALATADGARPDVCGYYSSTADRPAYGCYPENAGKEQVGHSFHFLRELAASGRMVDAHDATLVDDDTPDVPLRSSDVYAESLVASAAKERGVSVDALVDETLGPGWRDEPPLAEPRAIVDRIVARYGLGASVASLGALQAQRATVMDLERRLGGSLRSWKGALSDATKDNFDGFLRANVAWVPRLTDPALALLDEGGKRTLATQLIADLGAWTRQDKGDRLDLIEDDESRVEEAGYRTEVRSAAILRVRSLLVTLAARALLAAPGRDAERARYEAMRACEDLALPPPKSGATPSSSPPPPVAPFPSLADDDTTERATRPSWIGISFSDVHEDLRKERALPSGASVVTSVADDSPASKAGLEAGDVLLGPPGHPFTAKNQIRVYTMLSSPDQPEPLEVLRGTKRVSLTVTPEPLPLVLPSPAPHPIVVGSTAPPLHLRRYKGAEVNLKDGRPHLLLFWATWCGPCKASLPEVLAFEQARHAQVVAITSETKDVVDAFFQKWKRPFPATVDLDDYGLAFSSYGVQATPTFVLVDGKGVVRARGQGYGVPPGLPVDGWKWEGKIGSKSPSPHRVGD